MNESTHSWQWKLIIGGRSATTVWTGKGEGLDIRISLYMYRTQFEKLGFWTITDNGIGTVEGSQREITLVAKLLWKSVCSAARIESVVTNEHDSHS